MEQGAIGLLQWFRVYPNDSRTTLRWLERPEDLALVPLQLSPADAEATVQLSVYWMLPEWRDKMGLRVKAGEHAGGLMAFVDLGALDAGGVGWYGRWDVGYAVGQVLVESCWALSLGWQYEPLEAFAELHRWWERAGDWYEAKWAKGVQVRGGRKEREVDEATFVSEGVVRWALGGGVLCRAYGGRALRLVGRGLRR